jgi:hypothetical protein
VTISELITSVNIALGNSHVSLCLSADENSDTRVSINEITSGVNNAQNGCTAGLQGGSMMALGEGNQPISGIIEDVPVVTLEILDISAAPGKKISISMVLGGEAEAWGGMNVDLKLPGSVLSNSIGCELDQRLVETHELALAKVAGDKIRLLVMNAGTFPAPTVGGGLVVECAAMLAPDAPGGDYVISPSRFNANDRFGDPLVGELRAGILTVTSE